MAGFTLQQLVQEGVVPKKGRGRYNPIAVNLNQFGNAQAWLRMGQPLPGRCRIAKNVRGPFYQPLIADQFF
jgi:hypothetical protein